MSRAGLPTPATAPRTVEEAVEAARRRLEAAGIEAAESEAAQIAGAVLSWGWGELLLRRQEEVPAEAARQIEGLLRERLRRRPLQYVLGRTAFRDLVLKTDPRALIPRPETELLAEEAIRRLAARPAEGEWLVADVCCGCGALGLSVAAELPQARVILTDVSAEALDLARENVPLVPGVGARVEFRQGPDLAPLADVAGTLDAIVCNPPYVATGELGALQPEIGYEPRLALDGGEDGLDFYRRIAGQWRRFVRPDGFLAVEVGAGQAEEVRSLLGRGESVQVHTRRDYGGIERVVVVYRERGGAR